MKQEYVAPAVEELGALETFTLGGASGGALDNDFARGTPYGDLTFS